MSLVLSFADGFSSASAPTLSGGNQESYTILNNQASFVNFTGLDFTGYSSFFADFEIERSETGNEYRQSGKLIGTYDGAFWSLNVGELNGDELYQDSAISNGYEIMLQMNGQILQYKSGNMTAGSYSGTLKLSIARIIT